MKVIELYERSVELGIEEEELNEALAFVRFDKLTDGRKTAMCGYCANRLTERCPWPDQCKLANPACNDFTKKGDKK